MARTDLLFLEYLITWFDRDGSRLENDPIGHGRQRSFTPVGIQHFSCFNIAKLAVVRGAFVAESLVIIIQILSVYAASHESESLDYFDADNPGQER